MLRQGGESFDYLMEAGFGFQYSGPQGLASLADRNISRALLILIKIKDIDRRIRVHYILYVMSFP
jgi:hypothetical protein